VRRHKTTYIDTYVSTLLPSNIKKHTLFVLIAELKLEYYITYLIVT